MATKNDLVIKGWENGIGESSNVGFDVMQGVDIWSDIGSLMLPKGLAETVTTFSGYGATDITNIVTWSPTGTGSVPTASIHYANTRIGDVFKSTDNGTTWSTRITGGNSNEGAVIFQNYLIQISSDRISTYGPLTSGVPTWTLAWKTFTIPNSYAYPTHPTIIAQNGVLYIGIGRRVLSLEEKASTTFLPSDTATYTWNDNALDLPENMTVTALAELGANLMIGTAAVVTDSTYDAVSDGTTAYIYPWDTISDSFALPLIIPEAGVSGMITINGNIVIFAGIRGNVYLTNGTSVSYLTKLPSNEDRIRATTVIHDSITTKQGRIIFGLSAAREALELGQYSTHHGIYMMNADGSALAMVHPLSPGRMTGNQRIFSIASIPVDKIVVAYTDEGFARGSNNNCSIDYSNDLRGGSTVAQSAAWSPFIQVATHNQPRTFNQLSILLKNKLAANENIKIFYRTSQDETQKEIGYFGHAVYGAKNSYTIPISITCYSIQIQVYIYTLAAAYATGPQVLEVRLHGFDK